MVLSLPRVRLAALHLAVCGAGLTPGRSGSGHHAPDGASFYRPVSGVAVPGRPCFVRALAGRLGRAAGRSRVLDPDGGHCAAGFRSRRLLSRQAVQSGRRFRSRHGAFCGRLVPVGIIAPDAAQRFGCSLLHGLHRLSRRDDFLAGVAVGGVAQPGRICVGHWLVHLGQPGRRLPAGVGLPAPSTGGGCGLRASGADEPRNPARIVRCRVLAAPACLALPAHGAVCRSAASAGLSRRVNRGPPREPNDARRTRPSPRCSTTSGSRRPRRGRRFCFTGCIPCSRRTPALLSRLVRGRAHPPPTEPGDVSLDRKASARAGSVVCFQRHCRVSLHGPAGFATRCADNLLLPDAARKSP